MEPTSTNGILEFLRDWWFLLSAMVAFVAGFVRLKVKMDTIKERMDRQDNRLDRIEDRLDSNLQEIRGDVKELLKRIG